MSSDAESVRTWLVAWLGERGTLPSRDELDGFNYLTGGVIDSFAVLELVADSEDAFGIQYTPEDFQNRSFATIDGLTAIILARR